VEPERQTPKKAVVQFHTHIIGSCPAMHLRSFTRKQPEPKPVIDLFQIKPDTNTPVPSAQE
jgi:hypothetical protein